VTVFGRLQTSLPVHRAFFFVRSLSACFRSVIFLFFPIKEAHNMEAGGQQQQQQQTDKARPVTMSVLTSDGETRKVPVRIVGMFKTLQNMVEDFGGVDNMGDTAVPLHNINAATLQAVVDFALLAEQNGVKTFGVRDRLADWMRTFIRDQEVKKKKISVFDMIMALNYLDGGHLLGIAHEYVAEQMRGATPTELRDKFNIPNDFTPEEEAEIRRDNQWLSERA
jgi:S-phase kinase-associated protein 1